MKQAKLAFLLLVILAIALAGCGSGNSGGSGSTSGSNSSGSSGDSGGSGNAGGSSGSETSAPKKDPVTLTFVLANTVNATPFTKIFEKYTETTGNKVELQALPGGDFDNMMKTRFATGDFPDLFLMQPGTKQNVKLRAEETLYEWSNESGVWDVVQPSIKEFQTTAEGTIYGVPYGATGMMGVFYNKEVFEEVGVQPPKNYEDLIAIAQKIKAAGITPFYEAVKDGWPPQIFYLTGWVTYVDPEIGPEGVRALDTNQFKLAEIQSLRGLFEKAKQIKELGLFQDNALAGTYDELQDWLGEGKVAMAFNLEGIVPQLEAKFGKEFVEQKLGFFPFPSDTDDGIAMLTAPNQLMVPKEAKHAEEAVELVKFMLQPDMINLFYAEQPGIPIFKDAQSDLYPVQETVLEYINAGKATINVQNRLTPTFADLQKTLQTFFMNGDIDAAINEFSENYVKDGRSKRLPGFE
jgi:raffinose/stachyose/melibiose transport system substrate-binding protein